MRIQSKFKDYYDFASPYYDGSEKTIVFERKTEEHFKEVKKALSRDFNHSVRWERRYFDFPEINESYSNKITNMFVTVCDRLISFYKIEDPASHLCSDFYYSTEPNAKQFVINKWRDEPKTTRPKILKTSDYKKVVDLQEEYETPVILFYIRNHEYVEIVKNPCLMDYSINNVLFDTQQIYQDIEMWITNNKNKTPVSNITDPEKIISHGFDKKTSFRHPIK